MEDLARQLREHYPDGAFERSLHRERDLAGEEKYWSAIEELAALMELRRDAKLLFRGELIQVNSP